MWGIAASTLAELRESELGAWREMRREHAGAANPFLGPEFALAVERRRPGVRVAVLREAGGEPAGFLPYQRGPLGAGLAVGAGVSDCQGLVHRPGVGWEPERLLRACGLSVLEFDHLVEGGQEPFEPYVTERFASPVMDVSKGYEAYENWLRGESPKFLKTTLAKERRLGRQRGGVRFVFDERDPRALRALMEWKSAQYRRTGRRDRFAQPWIAGLVDDLAATRTDGLTGTLSVLYADDDRPIAAHFGLRSESVLACWFPAYDVEFAKYSPGLILHLRMAAAAAAEGLGLLDLGRGDAEYKDDLKTGELTVSEARVLRPSVGAALHRLRHDPVRRAHAFVRERPGLAAFARKALNQAGRLRRA